MSDRAIFLDRDGTVNEEVGYLSRPEDLRLINGAAAALQSLRKAGFKLIIVTNQSGAARGFFNEDDIAAVNKRLIELLDNEDVKLDAVYYCPHLDCHCRKPNTGMVERARREHGIDPSRSYVIGDKATDMKLAHNAGAAGIMVMTGFGAGERASVEGADYAPVCYAADITRAAEWIIERENNLSCD